MTRRYAEPVAVRAADACPSQFLWRGRLYLVRAVLAHWVEDRAWWRQRGPDGLPAVAEATEQEVWRVEAAPGRVAGTGVYDLIRDADGWRLARLQD
jgi:hypothetical protein